MTLFASGSYLEAMRSLLVGLEWVSDRFQQWHVPTKAAIIKARTRLGYEVMEELFSEVAVHLARPGGAGFLHGLRLVAVDGTTLDIPDIPANERFYGRPGTQTKYAFPQARARGVVDCWTHAVFGAVVSVFDTSEKDLFPRCWTGWTPRCCCWPTAAPSAIRRSVPRWKPAPSCCGG
jgi:hypothetical protein